MCSIHLIRVWCMTLWKWLDRTAENRGGGVGVATVGVISAVPGGTQFLFGELTPDLPFGLAQGRLGPSYAVPPGTGVGWACRVFPSQSRANASIHPEYRQRYRDPSIPFATRFGRDQFSLRMTGLPFQFASAVKA